jgi:hypothetical protein
MSNYQNPDAISGLQDFGGLSIAVLLGFRFVCLELPR